MRIRMMNYKLIACHEMTGKSNYVLNQIETIAEIYIRNCKNHRLRIKTDSVCYCPHFMFYNEAVWIIEIEEKVLKNSYFVFHTILISDKNGNVYETCVDVSKTKGETILTQDEAINIATEHKNCLEQKYKKKYNICTASIRYDMCFKNKENEYEPIWFIPVACEEIKIFSDPCHYLFVSDVSGEIIAIMNCHGRILEPSEM